MISRLQFYAPLLFLSRDPIVLGTTSFTLYTLMEPARIALSLCKPTATLAMDLLAESVASIALV